MKLTLQQLETNLTKNLAPIYIISSDELLLVQETAELIRHAALKQGFSDRILISADAGLEWGNALYSNTHSMSLFASKQIIELNMHQTKFNATTTKALQEYAVKPSQDTLLIIRTDKVDAKTEKSAWFQGLEKASVFVPIWPISAMQLPQWILQRANKIGLKLTKDAADFIANQVEGNLLAASQEIEKLNLLQTGNVINKTTLEESITDNARYTVFHLVESLLAGQQARSLRILKHLAAEDTEPTLVLWALTREYRTMAEIMRQLKQGASFSQLCTKFQIYEKRQAAVRAFLQRNTIEKCWDFLLKAATVDRMIKGAEKGNVWDELERLAVAWY